MPSRFFDLSGVYEHRVTFSEVDALGAVHHRCSAVWFEQAREAYFRKFGIPFAQLAAQGKLLALRELTVRFEEFIGYDDPIAVRVALTKMRHVSFDLLYRVDNLATGKLGQWGTTNMVAVEAKEGRRLPAVGRFAFDRDPFLQRIVEPDAFLKWDPFSELPPR